MLYARLDKELEHVNVSQNTLVIHMWHVGQNAPSMLTVHPAWPVLTCTALTHVQEYVVSMPSVELSTMHQPAPATQATEETHSLHVPSYLRVSVSCSLPTLYKVDFFVQFLYSSNGHPYSHA